ncbi:MAG: glutamine-hydrolyzing GMP synthase subunit GuaA [Candidatus Aenigmarchaeota archaeon]|nr:glutamine-hydrolyzing GMP synthase subunit GuaA [Candidatus Aenigmarchaeota archaeon]
MFDAEKFVKEETEKLKEKLTDKAMIACSGGVDSTVAAVLAKKAIGNNLVAVYVDTGMMRKNETEEVRKMFENLGLNFKIINASEDFLTALENVTEPEEKRKIIGERFIRVFEEEAKKDGVKYLIQGTIAPDWIESGGGERDTIKSHHNVGGLPEDIGFEIVEPLRDVYKDEVRKVARLLGVESKERQPFPGPGLAVRIVGDITKEKVEVVREANAIMEGIIEKSADEGKIEKPWQYFATLLSSKTVGVHGDLRNYGYIVAIRAVQSLDGMSASYSKIPHEVLEKISIEITNKLGDKVNRVVYDITNKPPGTIEFE